MLKKLLASILSISVMFSAVPTGALNNVASHKSETSSKKGLSIGEKLAIGLGSIAVATAAGVVIYSLSGGSAEDPQDQPPPPPGNRNFTNTQCLCYWHSFMQQMYSVTSFRDFINDTAYCDALKQDVDDAKAEIERLKKDIEAFKASGQTVTHESTETVTTTVPPGSNSDEIESDGSDDEDASDVALKSSAGDATQCTYEIQDLRKRMRAVADKLDRYLPPRMDEEDEQPQYFSVASDDAVSKLNLYHIETAVNGLSRACAQIKVIREIFQEMSSDTVDRISAEACERFARAVFEGLIENGGRPVLGRQHDIGDCWETFLHGVRDVYTRYCILKDPSLDALGISNIFENYVKIGDRRHSDNLFSNLWRKLRGEHRSDSIDLTNLLYDTEPPRKQRITVLQDMLRTRNSELRNAYPKFIARIVTWNAYEESCNASGMPLSTEALEVRHEIENTLIGEICDCKGPLADELKKLPLGFFDVPAIDDQFVVFCGRFTHDKAVKSGEPYKDATPIDFGDGKFTYKGEEYEVTAISVHTGWGLSLSSGHYKTYKKEANIWRLYNDCSRVVGVCTWPEVKRDAEKNCTMLTFSRVKSEE